MSGNQPTQEGLHCARDGQAWPCRPWLLSTNTRLAVELQVARVALEFYADQNAYRDTTQALSTGIGVSVARVPSRVSLDMGDVARTALAAPAAAAEGT